MHLLWKSSGPELEESTTNFARIGFRFARVFVVNTQQGACCFGSNGIKTTTENTSRFANLISGLSNVQQLLKPCTCCKSLLDLNLKNQQRLNPESDSDAQESRREHPAGRSLFWIKRDKNYDWKHKPVCQFDCRTKYRTVWLIPGTRLTDWVSTPNQNNERSCWINRRNSVSIFLEIKGSLDKGSS